MYINTPQNKVYITEIKGQITNPSLINRVNKNFSEEKKGFGFSFFLASS